MRKTDSGEKLSDVSGSKVLDRETLEEVKKYIGEVSSGFFENSGN